MSTNKSMNLTYTYLKDFDCCGLHMTVFAPPANIERKYIVEYKAAKVDVLDELPVEFVSILIQLMDNGYDILNVYYRGRNHKAEKYVNTFRTLLDKAVPQLER